MCVILVSLLTDVPVIFHVFYLNDSIDPVSLFQNARLILLSVWKCGKKGRPWNIRYTLKDSFLNYFIKNIKDPDVCFN